jgi:hypothetical protein
MRTQFIALFVLLGLIVGGHVEAQTWEQPYVLWPNGTGFSTTCGSSKTIGNFDGWDSYGPDSVYQIQTLQYPPHPIKPGFATTQTLTLVPEISQGPGDFLVFVCQIKFGYDADNCLEADNVYNPGSPIQVTIPPGELTFHIIVTSGMLDQNYNWLPGQWCGAYTLITSRH